MIVHIRLLCEWRQRAGLTALTDPGEIAVLHFLDSLTVFNVIPRDSGLAILDVGSGAGFPGLVLKTADPSLKLTVLDRDPKKIVFLKYVTSELGLSQVRFLNGHVADLIDAPAVTHYDIVISRAVFADIRVLESLSGLLGPRGSLVRMAGPASLQEPLELKGIVREALWEGTLPFSDVFRRVLRYVAA
jgi:16S rRNA (guanine527-N7)-methyltransferase